MHRHRSNRLQGGVEALPAGDADGCGPSASTTRPSRPVMRAALPVQKQSLHAAFPPAARRTPIATSAAARRAHPPVTE